jgi:hypothetical protein
MFGLRLNAGIPRYFMLKYLSVPGTKFSSKNQKSIDILLYCGTDMKRETHGAAIFTSVFRNPMYCFFLLTKRENQALYHYCTYHSFLINVSLSFESLFIDGFLFPLSSSQV